jgi:hypothetical protein
MVKAQTVSNLQLLGQFTGDEAETSLGTYNSEICSEQQVYGTDMGVNYSVTINDTKYIRFLFGDSFSSDGEGNQRNMRRSNLMGTTTDLNAADGVTGLSFMTDSYGVAKEFISLNSWYPDCEAVYPSSGFSVGTREYIYVAAVTTINPWVYNEGRLFYSDDQWNTAVMTNVTNYGLANWEFIYAAKGNGDGYIYFYGIPSSQVGSMQAMRIKAVDMAAWAETQTKYPDIYAGLDVRGNPIWRAWGYPPAYLVQSTKRPYVIMTDMGPGSVAWVGSPINRYMMLTTNFDDGCIRNKCGVELRTSTTPVGPWTLPIRITSMISYGKTSCDLFESTYYPYMVPDYYSNGVVYFIISRMSPWGNGGNNSCNSYSCIPGQPDDEGYPIPCHQVYNTFLGKFTFSL